MTTAARPDATLVARWFHALSDEARVQIVELLSHKERCVCELEQVLVSPSPVSHFTSKC